MPEKFVDLVSLKLHAKNNGKSDIKPCNDCSLEPQTCGKIIIRKNSLDCEKYQQPIVLSGVGDIANDMIVSS